jgi:hypothetical protein
MQYAMEARGFGRIEIMRLHPKSEAEISMAGGELSQQLKCWLFGPQDYALVAKKV